MKLPGCSAIGSLGCLIVGALLGALAIWLLIPRLNRDGLTPDRAVEKLEEKAEAVSEFANDASRQIAEQKEKFGGGKASDPPASDGATAPPEPVFVAPPPQP